MPHIEVEQKFDIAPDDPLPSPGDLVTLGETHEHHLRAIYFDTLDLRLVRRGIVLRRRTGGHDEGWHLKLPLPDGNRLEFSAPITDSPGTYTVPASLREKIDEALGDDLPEGPDGALLPVVVLETHRTETDLLQGETVVAAMADDRVTTRPDDQVWRELEVELVDGDEPLLARLTRAFLDQGLTKSEAPSKLARALADRPQRAAQGLAPPQDGPARNIVHAYLSKQVAVILGRAADVRVDAPDSVHKTRVATRRLRSALRTFRRLFDRAVTDPLRDEIRWFATVLGKPRDAEVMKQHIIELVDGLPERDVIGPVPARTRTELDERHTRAHAELVEVQGGERYAALLDRLVELLAFPPWRKLAHKPADKVLPPLVRSAVERAKRDLEAAEAAEGDERLRLLHETRKRAKAVRYASEALAPSFGHPAEEAAKVWEDVTETLGGLQDAVVADQWLTELAGAARAAGEPTVTYLTLSRAGLSQLEAITAQGLAVTERATTHPWP